MSLILVIDDDPTIRILLKRAFSSSGYNVQLAEDGLEGIELAEKYKPALIICDWLMPNLNGLEVCRNLKKKSSLATTFFILITSLVAIEDRVEGLDAGADDFICKPIDLQELQARVRAGLRLHQLSEDLQKQKQLLETELAEAADYVSSVLPEPLIDSRITIDFRFLPCRQLGGDIFDYFFLDEDHLVFYLLDVSGHGLKAALPSISVLNLLRSRSLENVNYYQPKEVLNKLNNTFQMTQKNDKYFTIWYGVLNLKTRTLIYSSAGHPPSILVSENQPNEVKTFKLKANGTPIGMFPDMIYQNQEYQITSTSKLYLFSDGIYELNQENGEIWGLDNFEQFLTKSNLNLEQIITEVKNRHTQSWLDDDISIMEIQVQYT